MAGVGTFTHKVCYRKCIFAYSDIVTIQVRQQLLSGHFILFNLHDDRVCVYPQAYLDSQKCLPRSKGSAQFRLGRRTRR